MNVQERFGASLGLALSCVLAAFGLCLRSDNALLISFELAGVGMLFASMFLAGVLLFCILAVAFSHDGEKRRWSSIVGLIASSLGTLIGMLAALVTPTVAAELSGVLLGFGLSCLLRQWGRYYRHLSPAQTLLQTALTFLLASLWWYIVAYTHTPFLFGLGLLVLIWAGGIPLLMKQVLESQGDLPAADVVVTSKTSMRAIMSHGWAPMVGLLFNFFTIGLTFWPQQAGFVQGAPSPKPLSYALVFLVVWWFVRRTRQATEQARPHLLETFCRLALPIAAAIMLASPFVDGAIDVRNSLLFTVVSYAGIALFNIIGLSELFWAAHASEVRFSKVFATFVASCAVCVALGMVVFALLGETAQIVSLCVLALYLMAMVIMEVRSDEAKTARITQTRNMMDEACQQLAATYALSEREAEILPYLARGRGAKHIAERLCISPDTVRTHTKRIYEKLDVHTREELLDRIDEAQDALTIS